MSEWWTYRLDDFLMFAPATYQRLFALHNAALWPAQWLAGPLGLLALWIMARRPTHWRAAVALVAVGWLATGWYFHWQRYAGIHTGGPWFAAAFALQALLLATLAWPGSRWQTRAAPAAVRRTGVAVLAFAVVLWPLLAPLLGRPWQQAALFGLTPDATALGTLALLSLLRRDGPAAVLPWAVPVLWCAVSTATLWTLGMADGAVLAGAAAVPLGALALARWTR